MQRTTTGRGLAIVAGLVATAGALAILLQDAIRTGNWTLEHGIMPILVGIAVVTGLLFTHALRAIKPLAALGFLTVAIAATWGTLYTSVGKQSEVASAKALVATDRAELKAKRSEIEESVGIERKAHAKECRTGKGKRCDGIKESIGTYEAALTGIDAKLEKLGPEPGTSKAETVAELIAVVTDGDKAKIKHALELIEPVTYSLIFELCAMVAFHYGFGHRNRAPAKVPGNAPDTGPKTQVRKQSGKPTAPRGPGRKTGRPSDPEVIDFVESFRTKYGRAPTGSEIRNEFTNCPKSTAYDVAARYRTAPALKLVAAA